MSPFGTGSHELSSIRRIKKHAEREAMNTAKKSASARKKRSDPAFKGWVEDGDGQKWTDPFERKRELLQRSGAPSVLVDAAIYVNDTLDVAASIALTHFNDPTPETVIAIYRLVCERHTSIDTPKNPDGGQ